MKLASGTLLVILTIGFVAPMITNRWPRLRIPSLVVEILLGIAVGPAGADLVEISPPIHMLYVLGLSTLIFMAGFEIQPQRMRGRPAMLALGGWITSVIIGLVLAGALQAAGVVRSELFVGFALTTTALGALLPIVRDAGLLPTGFGTHVLAIGSVGEFGPIIVVALVLAGTQPTRSAIALLVFSIMAVAIAVIVAKVLSARFPDLLNKTLHSSGQLHVRLALLLIVLMAFVADRLELDYLLGAFSAGVVYRMLLASDDHGESAHAVEAKLDAVAFGYVVPIFFVVTGIDFDLEALTANPAALLKVPLFLVLFLVVRGAPMVWYRGQFHSTRERLSLALLSATALPLVVVITELGVESGQMRSSTAAALVGAGMCSVVIFPAIGIKLATANEQLERAPEHGGRV